MAKVAFSLNAAALAALDAVGLRLGGLARTGRLADGSRIEAPTSIVSTVAPGAFLDVGAFCNLSGGAINNVRFGRYCSVAAGVTIGPHEHPTDWLTTSRIAYYPEVNGWDALVAGSARARIRAGRRPFPASCPLTVIGPDVWIGQGAFLKAGVTIGAGAIVGARATVLRDVPPYVVVVGTPARMLRLRFAEPVVERLLAIEWWRFSLYDLFDAPMDRIDAALDVLEALAARGAVAPWRGVEIGPDDLADPMALAQALAEDRRQAGRAA
jgi:acetyltransferase-like isoleucine patch superfamily enzyme